MKNKFKRNKYENNSKLVTNGLFDKNLKNNSINQTITYKDLIGVKTISFFTNWQDEDNFPTVYGSGVIFPALDERNKYILYITDSDTYLGKYSADTKITFWKKVLTEGA